MHFVNSSLSKIKLVNPKITSTFGAQIIFFS